MTHAHRRGAAGAPRRLLMLAATPTVVLLAGRGADAQKRPRYGGELVDNNPLDGVWLSE